MTPFAIVLVRGSGDVGSAVAHALYLRGAKVIVHDEPAQPHPRRGMAFADALFGAGHSVLEGVEAQRADNLESLLSIAVLDDRLPVSTARLNELLSAFPPDVLIDARMRKRASIEDQRALAPTIIGLGPGFDTRKNCTVAIETAWGERLGRVVREGSTAPLGGGPRPLAGVGRERFVYAPLAGRWHTRLDIGGHVHKGQVVGRIDRQAVVAPLGGILRGLSHDGATVCVGQKIVEMDPRADAQVRGLGERPRAIAKGVLQALNLLHDPQPPLFAFERSFEAALDCMPMSIRRKMDRCGLKLSLANWRALPLEARRTVLNAACETPAELSRLRRFVALTTAACGGGSPAPAEIDHSEWEDDSHLPRQVVEGLVDAGLPPLATLAWARLGDLQRFALCKLTEKARSRNLRAALEEFGLT